MPAPPLAPTAAPPRAATATAGALKLAVTEGSSGVMPAGAAWRDRVECCVHVDMARAHAEASRSHAVRRANV